MLKCILSKGFVKYSLLLVILILCVASIALYAKTTSGNVSENAIAAGTDEKKGGSLEIMDFYEIGNNNQQTTQPEQTQQNSDGDSSSNSESGGGENTNTFMAGSFGGSSGGGGGSGGGAVQCVPKHLECVNEQCVLVSGAGPNKCTTDADCDTHTECDENDACIVVQGGGEDQCVTYEDCAEHYICDYATFTCEKRPLSQQGDECEVTEENLTGKTPDLAKLNGGTNVTSKVRTSDNVYASQNVDTNPVYMYLFWNFTIPSEMTIDNATLSFEHKESSATLTMEWWNGSSYVEVCDPPEYAVDTVSTCDLSPHITTPQKANEIKTRLKYVKVDNCHGDVDWAYLEIGYSEHTFLDCFEKICDYENQTCKKVIPGTQGEACETYVDCQMCGNGVVESGEECDEGVNNGVACTPPYGGTCTYCNATCGNTTLTDGYCGDEVVQQAEEECELPGTQNNAYCIQNITDCLDKKLGSRDTYGNCTSECGCMYDPFVYSCTKGQCGAECAVNDDCDDQNPNTVDTCDLETCNCEYETQPYCGDGNVSGSEQCELPNTFNNTFCSQTTSQCQPSGRKLGTRDGYGNCGSSCGCTYDPFIYKCVKDVCGAECDSNDDCVDYCDGSVKHTSRTCGWCSTCLCSNGTTFDCNSLDGWYDTGSKQWVSTGECSEKEQKEQKYRDYNCGTSPAVECYYNVTQTKWVDTGQTRNKPDGTSCNDGLWCTDNDVCTEGSCGGSDKDCSDEIECTHDSCDETYDMCVNTPDDSECDDGLWCNGEETCDAELGCVNGAAVDCSGYNIKEIATCDNNPDNIHYTWDYGAPFVSVCDEEHDRCTTGEQNLTHTCSVDKCDAECDAIHGCANNTCSETYNDYCNGTKLVEYDDDKIKDSSNVTDSCENYCQGNCMCTECCVDCSPPSTNTYCVKDVCGAACASDDDCDDQNPNSIDTCNLKTCGCEHEYLEYCGNGDVEPPEQCELPNTFNNTFCSQTTSQCQPSGRKLGTRDGYGNCGSSCGCTYDPFIYKCVKDVCGAECDSNDDCVDYCDGSVKHTSRTCGWCSTCLCSNGTTFDCNSLDGWYDTTEMKWVDNGICKEKEQKKQEYRDYACKVSPAVDCYYNVTQTKWVDTGQTRNKPDGTSCNDGLWCTDNDVCTDGSCGGSERDCSDNLYCTINETCDEVNDKCTSQPRDCSGYNIIGIATCDNNPDNIHYTWDYRAWFTSVCDENNDRCTTGNETITHTCNKTACGAQCEKNSDCKCQEDGCVGIDWHDYPDYTTCYGNCTCGECKPTITECDPRCMGACKVEVYIGHDMNPSWGYPYTAKDDIYIVALDASGGACNGLEIPIKYWWCDCPQQDPEQIAIETMPEQWSAKYDRLCSADAAYYDGNNPTHSLECGNCHVREYEAKFPDDNGKKFWTNAGACQGTFQVDIPQNDDCYIRLSRLNEGKAYALGCAGQCEDQPTHMECQNMACVKISGYGDDQCNGDDCCYYSACDYDQNACVKKEGTHADECSAWSDCVHNECNYQTMTCDVVNSPGTDLCSADSECFVDYTYHQECVDNMCQMVLGAGFNGCALDSDCAPLPV